MRLLPPATNAKRVITLSISLPNDVEQEPSEHSEDASSAGMDRLIDVITASGLPVTWGVGNSLFGELSERFRSMACEQELAILGDESWLGRSKSRGAIVRVLNSAVESAEAAGFVPKSLLLNRVSLDADFDLLAKHNISLVACDDNATRSQAESTASPEHGSSLRTLRFGVWELPATVRLPRASSRLGLIGGGVNRLIDRALARGEVTHVAIDGHAMIDNPAELRALERLLERLARHQEQGKLSVQTLSGVASQLGTSPERTSATSILRSPAA